MLKKSFIALGFTAVILAGCDMTPTSDQVQGTAQETLQKQGNAVAGMPEITNFSQKKTYKYILEMLDNPNLHTYLYTLNYATGKLVLQCEAVGFPIPAATQYTNPQKPIYAGATGVATIPQADPSGLFTPSASDATWALCIDKDEKDPAKAVKPVYFEDKVNVSLFKLPQ